MHFVTFEHDGHRHVGVAVEDQVISLKAAGFNQLLEVLQGGAEAMQKVSAFIGYSGSRIPLSAVKLCAPIPDPPKILCMGLNYRDHAVESGLEIPKYPVIFPKYDNTVIGPGDRIVLPKNPASKSRSTPSSSPSTPIPSSAAAITSCCPKTHVSRITKPSSVL
jgi:2-keto-4-pentenoate hydratase/2-oxohepta-3-ene-1,7-dioic acid hydratase in catechol pathway